jgi:hypothetical protein
MNDDIKLSYKSIASSKVGPQYSFLETPSWYALAKAESWFNCGEISQLCFPLCGGTYGSNSQTELAHGVKSRGASVQNLLDEGGESSTSSPVLRELGDLLLGGNFTCEQEPEETLRKGLRATLSLGQSFLNLRDSLSTETNALLCRCVGTAIGGVKIGNIPASNTEPSQIRAGIPRIPLS